MGSAINQSPGGCQCGPAPCACGDFPCPAVLGVNLKMTLNTFPVQTDTLTWTPGDCPAWIWTDGTGNTREIVCLSGTGWAVRMISGGGTLDYYLSDLAASGNFTCSPFHISFDYSGIPVTITT